MSLTGRIIEWNGARGFGYVESEKRRIFLHVRDFAERHKPPEVGDEITFVLGADKQGRPCAQQAIHVNNGGRLKPAHGLILLFLLLPGYAVYRYAGQPGVTYATCWVLLISALTYLHYAADKRSARERGWRESEASMHFLELLGGWPGAFFAQRKLRHKSSKGSYQFVFVLIIGLHQFLAIDALRGWPFLRLVARFAEKS